MLVNYGSQLHFRCSFELIPKGAAPDWSDVVKAIREWVSKRIGKQEDLGRRWFFTGGEWKPTSSPRIRVQTVSCIGSGTERRPEYWAMRYEHPCDDVSFRQWQTDIGLTVQGSDRYRFVLTTTHSLRPGYIGDEPVTPVPSAPGIVTTLLRSSRWTALSGLETLNVAPVLLKPGQGQDLLQRLEAKNRCPLILVTLNFASQQPKVKPDELAKLLAGAAIVYSATSSDVDRELEWLLPKHLRCWNGMVRIYQPEVNRQYEPDGKRHRYFTAEDIDERSPAIVKEMIVRGIVRRGRFWIGDGVTTVEDVFAKQREVRLAELRAEAGGRQSDEWVRLLETDNAALNETLNKLVDDNRKLEEENEDLEDQISTLNFANESLKAHLEQVSGRRRVGSEPDSEITNACRAAIEGEPSLVDALTVISFLYSDRITVLDSAWRSAQNADLFEERAKAFKLMMLFATKYWSMLNAGEGNVKARLVFGEAFASKESETVERNSRARQLRTFEYDNGPVEMMSHLKIGVKPSVAKTWRMHFFWDADKRKLVVGHCGKHLDHD